MDVLSHKALLNLYLPSLEILKDFSHIPVSLSSSSAFLQAHIPPPNPGTFYGNLGLVLLKILGEHVILSSSHAKFSTGVKKMPLQIPRLKPLTNNKTNSIRF